MGFPMAVALVVVLGSLLVVWARTDREATSAPRVGDHWHSAYDIYVCDSYRSKIVLETDPNGIHSHGDGLLHIHPFNKLASGRDAVLGEFFSAFGGRIDDADEVLDKNGRPDELATAAAAAVREAAEEASVTVDPDEMVWFARWIPPPVMPRRFATFFFAARLNGDAGAVAIDDGEITDHEWMRPADAIARRDAGAVAYSHPRAHETRHEHVCRLLFEKKNVYYTHSRARAKLH